MPDEYSGGGMLGNELPVFGKKWSETGSSVYFWCITPAV